MNDCSYALEKEHKKESIMKNEYIFNEEICQYMDNMSNSLVELQNSMSVLSNIDWEKGMQNLASDIQASLSNAWETAWQPQIVTYVENIPYAISKFLEKHVEIISSGKTTEINELVEDLKKNY